MKRRDEYVQRVTAGEGFMPWQPRDYPSDDEREFRVRIERRKDELLANRDRVAHPVLTTPEQIARAKRNVADTEWGAEWFVRHRERANYIVAQPDGWIEKMIPEATPTNPYGFTCPNCVGEKSQEGVGYHLLEWDYRKPDVIACGACGHEYPSEEYPQTGQLACPRTGETFTFYINEDERAHGDPRDGKHAWRWVGYPMHVSFDGIVRNNKVRFMLRATESLAFAYALTDDPRYAAAAVDIFNRFAWCYPNWLYHDYWDTVADCDPLYAAWRQDALPLEWKRHPSVTAYAKDQPDAAAMLQNFWGAGRIHPSMDDIATLTSVATAYDLVHDAVGADGKPLWNDEQRRAVEENFLLEWVISAEPWIGYGDPNEVRNTTNKAPQPYAAQAAVARCLGIDELAVRALTGYEIIRDDAFMLDGMSPESPGYTKAYLGWLARVPELLHGFPMPADGGGRHLLNLYETDEKLRIMYRTALQQRRPNGQLTPLGDTRTQYNYVALPTVETGRARYPEIYRGTMKALYGDDARPGEYAVFNLDAETVTETGGFNPPEMMLPAWMAAWLRNGRPDARAAMAAMTFNFPGNHLQADNLGLYYVDGGHTMLGELGYVGDTPINTWIRDTRSHNVAIVDDAPQTYNRRPSLTLMATSPGASVVEASSTAYPQCSEYRRQVVLLKGPDGRSVLVDIFRIAGGRKHALRVWSELASSDAGAEGALRFEGVEMPAEPPLPQVGGSLERDDIFGVRDVRRADDPAATWQAVWAEPERSYRLWMLSTCDAVEAANMPGQERHNDPGRRVRVVDAIRELGDRAGEDAQLTSTFVAVHDPSNPDGEGFSVTEAKLLDVPELAGPDALAVRVQCPWGTYLLCSEFDVPAEVEGVTFGGRFGVLCLEEEGGWLFAVGAETLRHAGYGFAGETRDWTGLAESNTDDAIVPARSPADGLPTISEQCKAYVLVNQTIPDRPGDYRTGYPVRSVSSDRIGVDRYPLGEVVGFELPTVRFERLGDE